MQGLAECYGLSRFTSSARNTIPWWVFAHSISALKGRAYARSQIAARRERHAFSPPTAGVFHRCVFSSMLAIAILVLALAAIPSQAQPFVARTLEADTIADVVYRRAPRFNGAMQDLRLRMWRPTEQPMRQRPLVVLIHGGGFVDGSYLDMSPWCLAWAQRGYVTATVQYRLGAVGSPLLDPPYVYDAHEGIRGAWRAVQDVRHAIRFLFANAARYGIDTSSYIVLGMSAGAITALHHGIRDPKDIIPNSVFALPDAERLAGRVQRPSIVEPTDTLPFPLPCAVVNYFGGIMHPDWLDGAPLPNIFSYHQTGDIVVNCNTARGLWAVPLPGVSDNWPVIHGSCALRTLLDVKNVPEDRRQFIIHEGLGHELHNPTLIDSLAAEFCSRCIPPPPTHVDASSTIDTIAPWMIITLLGQVVERGIGTLAEAHEAAQRCALNRYYYIIHGQTGLHGVHADRLVGR